MLLSADELQILDYLRGWNEKFITMMEICRRAGGRRKYEDTPDWAKNLMSRLVEGGMVQVNERGHYRIKTARNTSSAPTKARPTHKKTSGVVDENYFPPPPPPPALVDENYFPPPPPVVEGDYFPDPEELQPKPNRWTSPEKTNLAKQPGTKSGGESSEA